MTKTQLHSQQEALSVYFRDMLNAPLIDIPAEPTSEPAAAIAPPLTDVAPRQIPPVVEPAPSKDEKYLLCNITDLKIAFELLDISTIMRWPHDGLISIPRQSEMVLGLLNLHSQQTLVLDLNVLLHHQPLNPHQSTYRYLLLFDNRRYAIACNQLEQIQTIEPEQIDTRRYTDKPWLKGMIKHNMHTIIHLPALLQHVLEQE